MATRNLRRRAILRGRVSRRTWLAGLLSAALEQGVRGRAIQLPPRTAAVLYRGRPAGTARPEDLAAIRATGFVTVAWRRDFRTGEATARELATKVGLQFITVNLTASTGSFVKVDGATRPRYVEADAWRALQEGASTVLFDPGVQVGTGLTDSTGRMRPWVEPARTFSRQLTANARLLGNLTSVPVALLDAGGIDVRVSLHQADRAWVLIATCAIAKADIWEVSKVNTWFIGVLLAVLLLVTYVPPVAMGLVYYFYR